MIGAAEQLSAEFKNLQFIIPIAPGLKREEVADITTHSSVDLTLVDDSIYEVIDISTLVVVASGTATLETALLETPMVIVYKMSPVSYLVGKKLIKVDCIGMANLIAGKKVVPELIQNDVTAEKITGEVTRMLKDTSYYQSMCKELTLIKSNLGTPGASTRAAEIALKMIAP